MRGLLPPLGIAVFAITLTVATWAISRSEPFARLMATDEGSPGEWRLTYQPDWVAVFSAAVLLAAVVAGGWLLAAGRGPKTIGPYVLAAVLASAVLLVGGTMPGFASIGCDGSVPRWMLPDGYDGSGCIPWPENAEATQPWDNEEMVCLGLCGDETLPFR